MSLYMTQQRLRRDADSRRPSQASFSLLDIQSPRARTAHGAEQPNGRTESFPLIHTTAR
jgi:hypothetical protein